MLKKRLGKKGFTLVELIVVLVILAILAAILIPSMVGWIKKAENKGAAVAGRTLVLAMQTIVSENYPVADGAILPAMYGEANTLAELGADTAITGGTVANNVVTVIEFQYNGTEGYTFTNDGSTGLTEPS